MALAYGKLTNSCVHLCVDMQRMFAEPTDWQMEWMPRVLPLIQRITTHYAAQTVFTRFIPARNPEQATGAWKRFYARWAHMTTEQINSEILELVPELSVFVPPAIVIDKFAYSPWIDTNLHQQLRKRDIDTLVITGGETDMCVLATVLGAVDFGYRVIIATDALCSTSDEAHDAQLAVYRNRYSLQIETATTAEILTQWHVE